VNKKMKNPLTCFSKLKGFFCMHQLMRLLVSIHGTPRPTAPGSDIFSKYRSPRSHGVLHTLHVDDSTILIVYCALDDNSFFFFLLPLLPLLLPFCGCGAILIPPDRFCQQYMSWAQNGSRQARPSFGCSSISALCCQTQAPGAKSGRYLHTAQDRSQSGEDSRRCQFQS